jgi:hypothetical protein
MEKEFEEKLQTINPQENVLALVKAALTDIWNNRTHDMENLVVTRQEKERDIEKKIKNFTARIGETSSKALIEEYEHSVEELKAEKLRLGGSMEVDASKLAKYDFGTALRIVFDFIKNPYQMWKTGNLQIKRLVLRLVYSEPLVYTKGIGFGTMSLSLPVEISCLSVSSKEQLVEVKRLEPLGSPEFCTSWSTVTHVPLGRPPFIIGKHNSTCWER